MSPANLQVLMFVYFTLALILALAGMLGGRHRLLSALTAIMALIGLAVVVQVAAMDAPGRNFIADLWSRLLALSRTDLTALLLGISAALPLSALLFKPGEQSRWTRSSMILALFAVSGTLIAGSGFVAKDLISPYLPNPGSESGSVGLGRLAEEGFVVADYADTDLIPVRVAVSPDGRLFISGHRGIAAQEGAVAELYKGAEGTVKERLVARMLNRPYGLVATNDELFVSRSGQYTRWRNGKADQISTGAVTRLRDLDGDGIMDWYDDVVTDLPGAKGPDYLHQNNALTLGPDGALYITTANHSDAHPATQPWEGVILGASGSDFETVDIYATGLRNPFGLVFDGQGTLYATDNDSQSGKLGGNLGDKLLEVVEGAFYGHPYAHDEEPGVLTPLLRSSFALGGLTYAPKGALPGPWDDSLYLVIYGEGRIVRLDFGKDDAGNVKVDMIKLATVPGAVDAAISPTGEIFVAVYPDKIVRITHDSWAPAS